MAARERAARADTGSGLLTATIGVAFCLVWSSAFAVAKVLVLYAPPFTILSLRFLVAAAIAGGIALALGHRLPRTAAAWRAIVLLGLCQNTLYLGLFFFAMTRIPAGLAVIIASALPLLVASIAVLALSERVGAVKLLGLAMGFSGVLWVMGERVAGGVDPLGVALGLLGTAALAVATVTVKRVAFGTSILMVVALQMAVGALGCLPVALLLEDVTAIEVNPVSIAAFLYQVLFPGILATVLWFTLVKRISAASASSYHFLNPIFGVAFAWALLGERLTATDAIGVALVAGGILLVNRPQRA